VAGISPDCASRPGFDSPPPRLLDGDQPHHLPSLAVAPVRRPLRGGLRNQRVLELLDEALLVSGALATLVGACAVGAYLLTRERLV
jgi:hypothetical protein